MNINNMQNIQIAKSESDILKCFPVMAELRTHLKRAEFVAQVQRQGEQGYFLAYVTNPQETTTADKPQVVAVAGLRLTENLSKGKHIYVDDLVTSEKHRSKKYGEKLLEWIIDYAKKHKCVAVDLDSGVQRYDAHRFYMVHRFIIVSHHFSLTLK